MHDIPNNLISSIGMLNRTCTVHRVSWQILKYPDEQKYIALVTPLDGDVGAQSVEAELIDDLFEKILEVAETY